MISRSSEARAAVSRSVVQLACSWAAALWFIQCAAHTQRASAPPPVPSAAHAEPPTKEPVFIGSTEDATNIVRASLAGTTSHCELGPPSAEERLSWRRYSKPRALGRASLKQLLARSDIDLAREVIDRLYDEYFDAGLGHMTEVEQRLYLIEELAGEVNNGGFDQYFINSAGDCAARTLAAARIIDERLGALVEEALSKFPGGAPDEDRAKRNAQMRSIPDESHAWSRLDQAFYELDMLDIEARYIRAHVAEIDSPPQPDGTR